MITYHSEAADCVDDRAVSTKKDGMKRASKQLNSLCLSEKMNKLSPNIQLHDGYNIFI